MSDHRQYLEDMLDYLKAIESFTSEGYEAFTGDLKTQFAVIRAYEVIGEIAKRFPESFQTVNSHINWRELINFRDFLAHNYQRVKLVNIWAAIEDLPNLKAAVEDLLAKLPPDETEPPPNKPSS